MRTCRRTTRVFARLLALILALTTTACSGSATITRRNGQSSSGRILTSDAKSLQVQDDRGGAVMNLPRADVEAIDHPGNVLLIAGLVVLGMVAQITFEGPQTPGELATDAVIGGLPALSMISWGGIQLSSFAEGVVPIRPGGRALANPRSPSALHPSPKLDTCDTDPCAPSGRGPVMGHEGLCVMPGA